MSEPLSSTEIEDVLSSIRRLVSDDLRPLVRSAAASPAPVAADKLILTPALRVVQDEAPQLFAAAAPYRLHLGLPAQSAPAGLDQVVASVGAAVDAQALEWEAETGDAAPFVAVSLQDEWQDSDIAAFAPVVDTADEIILRDAIDDPHNDTHGDTHDDPHNDTLGADPEVLHPMAAAPMPGWAQQEPDGISDPPQDDLNAPVLSHGTLEPDPAWADAAEASVIASLAAEAGGGDQDTADPADAGYDDAPMLFDEEVLRELVRDILREELAGRMGERITRNIRKLVRAEIARSFATQEFE